MSQVLARTQILVCEDSATYARALAAFLQHDENLEVVGICATGEEVLASLARLSPDLVTVGLELPGIGGLETIRRIMCTHPVPILVVSAHVRRGSERAAAALAAGALEAIPKKQLQLDRPDGPAAVALRHRLRRLAGAHVGEPRPRRPARRAPRLVHPGGATVVGLCASTGGPHALEVILSELPADFPLPVLVVQHMTSGFIDGLVRWMDQRVPLPVAVARQGASATPGVWFAPDDAHLLLEPSMRLVLDGETEAGAHRPSANVLLESMARAAGATAVGVVLTGMGRDGAKGVAAICRTGGCVLAQDEQTSVVFGMPKAAIEQGANAILPLEQIAPALKQLHGAKAAA
jgi:two-component system chemotaxis response regulator CheB